jgi:hypothetical protein
MLPAGRVERAGRLVLTKLYHAAMARHKSARLMLARRYAGWYDICVMGLLRRLLKALCDGSDNGLARAAAQAALTLPVGGPV